VSRSCRGGPSLATGLGRRADTPIRITDPATGHTRHFAPLARPASAHEAFTLPLTAVTDRDGRLIDIEDDRIVGLRLRDEEAGPDGTTLRLQP
jgi:hypothetical protein